MALRARLASPPPPPTTVWPYHAVKWGGVSVLQMLSGDRRMEAQTYLSSGFGIRASIEAKGSGWVRFSELARVTMPGRLKGIQVSPEYGTPFLAATQVFDARPIPRKWLALERMEDARERFAPQGTILVTRSGSVGRPTIVSASLQETLISDDLLRVEAIAKRDQGWLYAYLHTPQARAMSTGVHYGHIIKHLEIPHLQALPVPVVDDETAAAFERRTAEVLELRNEAYRLTLEAEARFERALGPLRALNWGESGFEVRAGKTLVRGRRRFDAGFHNPGVAAVWRHLTKRGKGFVTIAASGYSVWLPKRFRRIPATDGVWLLDSADLTEANPELSKRIADGDFGDPHRGRVEAGWLLMARSGQTYGIIGTTMIAGKDLEGHIVSDHVMRIKPGPAPELKPGYLLTAMSHPTLGRPLLKALAYGSSIPEIEVADIAEFRVVRLEPTIESAIADLAEAAAEARAKADVVEKSITEDAAAILDRFIAESG